MSRASPLVAIAFAGCFWPGDLPSLDDDVPVVGQSGEGPCARARDVDVSCVVDGDTIDVDGCGDRGERVRLLGIDAPELAKDGDPAECYAEEARDALTALVERRRGVLTFDATCADVFGRTLAYLWVPEDHDAMWEEPEQLVAGDVGGVVLVNEWLLDRGLVRRFADEALEGDLLLGGRLDDAARGADADGRGLHAACDTSD